MTYTMITSLVLKRLGMVPREARQMSEKQLGSWEVKRGLAEHLKGGVIMDVTTPEQESRETPGRWR